MSRARFRFMVGFAVLAIMHTQARSLVAELPSKPIPAYSLEAQAQRDAASLKREGDRLQEAGRPKEAREKWLGAVEAFRRSGYKPGEVEALLRLGTSYQMEAAFDPQKESLMRDFMIRGIQAGVDYLVDIARRVEPVERGPFEKADAQFQYASELVLSGNCKEALGLFSEARRLYSEAGSAAGEVRSWGAQMNCTSKSGDMMGLILNFAGLPSVAAEKIKMEAGSLILPVLHLKAIGEAESGNWKDAEDLYRGVLRVYEAAQDIKNVALVALDLGGLLAENGHLDEAEKLFQKARDQFAGLPDQESRRNEAATLQNLADIYFAVERLDEAVSAYRLACDKWRPLGEPAREVAVLKALSSALRAQGKETSAVAALDEARELEEQRAGGGSDLEVVPKETQIQSLEARGYKALVGSKPLQRGDDFVGTPVLAQSPHAQAQREATVLLGEGDRLLESGDLMEAREKWLASVEAYKRAANGIGAAKAYGRLADSHLSEVMVDKTKRLIALDYYIQSIVAAAEFYDSLQEGQSSSNNGGLEEASEIFERALRLVASGKCSKASTLLVQARDKYRGAGSPMGEAKSLMLRARCQVAEGNDVGALLTVMEAKPILEDLPVGTPTGELELTGLELYGQGHFQKALDVLQEALCRYEEERDFAGIASTLIGLGAVQSSLGDFRSAESSLQRALILIEAVNDDGRFSNEAAAHHNFGLMFLGTGRSREAVIELRAAVSLRRKAGEPDLEVISLSALALALRDQGDYSAALEVLNEAERLQTQLTPDKEVEGDLLTNRGSVYLNQGRYQDALAQFRQAVVAYRHTSKPWKEWQAVANMASVETSRGNFPGALRTYKELEDRSGLLGDAGTEIRIKADVNRAAVLVQSGDYQLGIQILLSALPKVVARGELSVEATIHNSLGAAYLAIGDLASAEIHFGRAAEVFHRIGNREGVAAAMTNRGLLLLQAQKLIEAAADLKGALEMWDEIGNSVMADRVRVNLGLLSALDEVLEQELQSFEEVRVRFQTLGLYKDALRVSVLEAAFNLQHGRFAAALENSEEIIEGAAQIDDATMEFSGLNFALAAHFLMGDHESALADLKSTMEIVDIWQAGLTASELKSTFLAWFFDTYAAAVALNVVVGRPVEAFRFSEQARARVFLDQLGGQRVQLRSGLDPELIRAEGDLRSRIVHLREEIGKERERPISSQRQDLLASLGSLLEEARRNYSTLQVRLKLENPELAALIAVDVIGLKEAQQTLDQETVLIEYFVPVWRHREGGEMSVLAWVVEKESYALIQLPVTAGRLAKQVDLFRSQIETQQDVGAVASALYRDLFAPLVPHLRHRNVILVPHGVLHFLPFAALWDAERRSHLGKLYTLSYAPSATILKFVRERQVPPRGPILAVGNPDGSLPEAAREAKFVAALYGAEPLLGSAATESSIVSRAGEAGILHLAAHADLNPINPLFTAIRLAPDGANDGNLEMHEVYGLDLSKTGLVVLSACQTQMGKLSRGDEIEGLTRAFLYAGTPAVMSSLWDVDDESTAFFMERFYIHLRKGKGRAEALRKAQMETRRRFPDPYHWAAFVLTGDGR